MNFTISHSRFTSSDFNNLSRSVGWTEIESSLYEKGLDNSLAFAKAVSVESEVIACARLVGDGISYVYIQDLIVHKNFQGLGIAKLIVENLENQAKNFPGFRGKLTLIAEENLVNFYNKLGYLENLPISKFLFKTL